MPTTIRQILLILILAFACQGEAFCATHPDDIKKEVASLTSKSAAEAIISNGQNNYRFNSSRPQRLIPVNGSRHSRTNGKLPHPTLFKQPLSSHIVRRLILLSTPLLPFASCGDIIIALRHIVR